MLADARLNAALDAAVPASVKLSVHDAYSATGAGLIAGPIKTAGTMTAAASRSKPLSAAVDILSIPAAAVVRWIGMWDGTTDTIFIGMFPNGGSDKSFQVDTTVNERILCEGHGYVNGDTVVFHNGNPGTALAVGTAYFVVLQAAADPDYFSVALTSGGAAINLTDQPAITCRVSKLVQETYASAGTHRVSTLAVSL